MMGVSNPSSHPLLLFSTILGQPERRRDQQQQQQQQNSNRQQEESGRTNGKKQQKIEEKEKLPPVSMQIKTGTPLSTTTSSQTPPSSSSALVSVEKIEQWSDSGNGTNTSIPNGGANTAAIVDLDTFLRATNLNAKQTAQFKHLLEAEVARRLESRLRESNEDNNRGGGRNGKRGHGAGDGEESTADKTLVRRLF